MLSNVRTLLLADPTFTGLVGTKVYPQTIPQEAQIPLVLLEQTARNAIESKDSVGGLDSVDFSVTVFAANYDTAETICEQARTVLDDHEDSEIIQLRFANEQNRWEPSPQVFTKTYGFKALQK